jgi:hypothetical protein
MPSRSDFSRGNRQLSGSDPADISEVNKQSPVNPKHLGTITIEPCANNPCEGLSLAIYNVMGQEDKFRRVDGSRVSNGGTARITITTDILTDIEEVKYEANPSNEDSPSLDLTWNPSSKDQRYHEFFVSTDPSSLYAFQVTAKSTDCPETVETSDIYYFSTGDEIVVKKSFGDEIAYSIDIISVNEYLQLLDMDFKDEQGAVPKTDEVDWTTSQSMTDVLITTNEFQEIDITDSFSYTIS